MAFRTGQGSATPAHEQAFSEARNIAADIKTRAQRLSDASAAGNVVRREVWGFVVYLDEQHTRLGNLAAIPGLAAYAQAQYNNDVGYDIAAEFTAMRSAVAATRDWIINNAPVTASNQPIVFQISGSTITSLIFTPAQTAGLRTELTALIATID